MPSPAERRSVSAGIGSRLLEALGLALAVLATFSSAVFTTWVFYRRDVHAYFYPLRAVVRRAVAEGALPLWNPYLGFGAPLLADSNTQLAYPPTWLALLLTPALHDKLFAVGHTLLAVAGGRALARRLGLGRTPSALAGLAYGLSGPVLSAVSLHHHAGIAWLPWTLWAFERLLRAPGIASALGLGLVAAAQIVAGSPDMCLAAAMLGTARLALYALRPRGRHVVRVLGHAALAAALALTIAAVQWLPTAALARGSLRAAHGPRASTYWSLHPASLLDLAMPRLVADLPLSEAPREALSEGREPFLACVYLGIVPLVLAGLGLATWPRVGAPLAAGFVLFLLASLGRFGPLYGTLLAIPGFGMMRYPQKLLLPAALCLSVLAGLGAEGWSHAWSGAVRRRARLVTSALAACSIAAVLAAIHAAREPAWLGPWLDPEAASLSLVSRDMALRLLRFALGGALICLLLVRRGATERGGGRDLAALVLLGVADLVLVGRGINPLAPPELLSRRPAVVAEVDDGTRIHATMEEGCRQPGQGPPGWPRRWVAAFAFQETLRPPSGGRWGVFGSFDGDFTGLGSAWTGLFTAASHRLGDTPTGTRLLEIANVGHVLHVGRNVGGAIAATSAWPSGLVCPLVIRRVPAPLPRAYVVHGEREADGPEATLALLLAGDIDPRREVVVERAVHPAPVVASEAAGEARILKRASDRVVIEAQLGAPGLLVLLDAYDPGWRAQVDGRPAEVLRANGLFRAVRLDAGAHRVTFSYRPRSVTIGALLSAVGLVLAAALGLASRRRGA